MGLYRRRRRRRRKSCPLYHFHPGELHVQHIHKPDLIHVFFADYKLATITFDDEADTIIDSRQKNYPLSLSGITTVTYNENKKGRFRYLLIHDAGVGFMQIRTSKENADKMTAQILKANPSAEVKHANYI